MKFSKEVQMSGFALRKEDYFGSKFVDFLKFIIYLEKCLLRFVIVLLWLFRQFQVFSCSGQPPPSSLIWPKRKERRR